MHTEFRRATVPQEIPSLIAFDHRVFPKGDWFSKADWETYISYWMMVGKIKVGCCAFQHHVDFQEDIRADGVNPALHGSLYISSTGILPRFQRMGFGALLKCWQITYARRRRFTRIVTNTRKHNVGMIRLNRKFGFQVVRVSPNYYTDPADATVVMELRL
ncbi:MAG TPA: N-acetyltransferase [Bryobacteraceae bacterium]|nr:N-acetyltransferase [Bryobacteraceae bacterium]